MSDLETVQYSSHAFTWYSYLHTAPAHNTSAHYTVHTTVEECTAYIVQCTVCIVQCTLSSVQCTVYSTDHWQCPLIAGQAAISSRESELQVNVGESEVGGGGEVSRYFTLRRWMVERCPGTLH